MRPVDCVLDFKIQGGISWCTFHTNHFCSYCLFRNCQDPKINRIGVFFLKPKNFQTSKQFTVEIWFSFPISECLKRNEELYTSKGMILDSNCCWIFEASTDKNSTSYFDSSYDQCVDGWQMDYFRYTKIPTKEVNFYNYYTNKEDLEAIEEISLFPPRFTLSVEKKSDCNNDLDGKIKVTFFKAEGIKSVESVSFKLIVPITAPIKVSTTDYKMIEDNSIPLHQCDENIPEFKDLIKYSTKISAYWKQVAILLGVPKDKVFTINLNYQRIEEKCLELFNAWLNRTVYACWCHFIQALFAVGLNDVAEEVKTHLKPRKSINITSSNLDIGEKLNADYLYQLERFLNDVPDRDLNYFITHLLSKDSAVKVIKDIRRSGGNKEDNVLKICQAFLKEKESSWYKVHEALKEAKCYDLADIVEACFLPI